MAGVVGRQAELELLDDFVARIPSGAAALVLVGEAGMGKTTLFDAGVGAAQDAGARVLRARPSESEKTLSFAGVRDLFDPVLERALGCLPDAQKRALARALVLEDDEAGPPPDAHAVGVAVLGVVRELASSECVVIAVDDVQWLDEASAGALGYAGRRLEDEQVGVLLARRTPLESALVGELRRSVPAERFAHVEVGPLDVGSLGRVIQDRLGVVVPRPLLAEVHQAAGGNPFYAQEIVRTLQRTGASVEAGSPLPVPDSLHDLVHDRLLALPPESRDFLAAAAAHAHPTLSITEDASGVDRAAGLAPALEARVVEMHMDEIRFTHPLLAAGALETVDPLRRREIHARLAELLADQEARAWQLAASVTEPDGSVAAALEDAARHARDRGAPRPAALLLERAELLTPRDRPDEAVRRGIAAAVLHFECGDSRRAAAKVHELMTPLEPGPERARALVVLARIRLYERPDEARALFAQVIAEAGDDRHTLGVAHEGAAACSIWMFESFDEAVRHTDVALELAEELRDDGLAADTILTRLSAETLLGRDSAAATAERALALRRSAEGLRVMDQPLIALVECWTWTDSLDRSRAGLAELMNLAGDHGDENARPWLQFLLGFAERTVGNLDVALELAREGQVAAEQSGQPLFDRLNQALEALVLAELGRAEPAREAAEQALAAGMDRYVGVVASAALGHLELTVGAPARALAHLDPQVQFVRSEGIVEPGALRFVVDQIEALIELGRREEALELLDWYEGNARRLMRASALANCRRCRGLVAAQTGELESALAALEEALEWHAKVELPLDRGRTLLVLGAAQRRSKRRREARATLEEALAVFDRMGAQLWAERTRAELKRISGRAASPGALTPAEERVAALVAEGKTNREVAAALYLSDRTVEGHLSHIFGKLGIRHRTELARALQTRGIELSNTGETPVSAESPAP
jgi:DNA-binding CsgD family transcriptional regulator